MEKAKGKKLNVENIFFDSVYKDLRFVEQLGSGIHRILKAYDESIFKMSDNFLEISFPFEKGYVDKNKQVTGQKAT